MRNLSGSVASDNPDASPPARQRVGLALAVVWGVCATWVYLLLDAPFTGVIFRMSEPPLTHLLRSGWSADQIDPYFSGVVTVLSVLFYGFIFGFPLGLFLRRFVVVYWIAFVAAFFITLTAHMLADQLDYANLVENLTHPFYWRTALAVLLFVFIGYRVRSAYASRRAT